jgi:GTP cyclohydrolase II
VWECTLVHIHTKYGTGDGLWKDDHVMGEIIRARMRWAAKQKRRGALMPSR